MSSKAVKFGAWSVAFVWFSTHFGGGFASGRQLVDFFVNYGWYALVTPFISAGLIAITLYFAWDYAVVYKVYDYRTWSDSFFSPVQMFFSNVIELFYLTILVVATGVAFATGSTMISEVLGTPYLANSVVVAFFIFFLTIYGAETVRRAATIMSLLIIAGMLVIYTMNLVTNFPLLAQVIKDAPAPKGFWDALLQSFKYAGLQCSLVGAYTAVADVLKTRDDAKRAAIYGFVVNAGVLALAAIGVLAHYPSILEEKAPVLYITRHGGGGEFGVMIVSGIILLAVISTGVGLIYGGTRRISNWWAHRVKGDANAGAMSRKADIIASAVYVLVSWGVASFGLIPLISKGYAWIGTLSAPIVMLPIILFALAKRSKVKRDWERGGAK